LSCCCVALGGTTYHASVLKLKGVIVRLLNLIDLSVVTVRPKPAFTEL